jgi:hypothetical protein
MTTDSDRVTAEVVGELPRLSSHDDLDRRLAERLLAGFSERSRIEAARVNDAGSVQRVWLQFRDVSR